MPILTEQERCGTTLADKYLIESILGRGGMGVVFRARHLHTDRPVAIKILRPDLSHDLTLGRRFIREAKAASLLRHPNVVEVLDLGIEDDGTVYQVLELLDGSSLGSVLEFKGSLGVTQTLEILLPVMDALVAAHDRGIIHRDLKPDNIFLARSHDGRLTPTLLDFGIAKMMDGKQSLATRTGSVMGTPHYMAPEQARGSKAHGPGIDIWAMGIIAFECLTGAVPFDGESPTLVLLKILTERAPRLDGIDPAIPAPIAEMIDGALRPDPAERHASMSAFLEGLRAAAEVAGYDLPGPRVSTVDPLTFPPPNMETDPVGVTELPEEEVLSLAEAIGSLGGSRSSEHDTLAARPNAGARIAGGATLLGPGAAPGDAAPAAAIPAASTASALGAPGSLAATADLPMTVDASSAVLSDGARVRSRGLMWGAAVLAAAAIASVLAWAWPREPANRVVVPQSAATSSVGQTEDGVPPPSREVPREAPVTETATPDAPEAGEQVEDTSAATREPPGESSRDARPGRVVGRADRAEEGRSPPSAGPDLREPRVSPATPSMQEPADDGRLPGVVEW